jgi:hypothetical protein
MGSERIVLMHCASNPSKKGCSSVALSDNASKLDYRTFVVLTELMPVAFTAGRLHKANVPATVFYNSKHHSEQAQRQTQVGKAMMVKGCCQTY